VICDHLHVWLKTCPQPILLGRTEVMQSDFCGQTSVKCQTVWRLGFPVILLWRKKEFFSNWMLVNAINVSSMNCNLMIVTTFLPINFYTNN
jgi:hypothetical protein